MGCGGISPVQQPIRVSITHQMTNSYIDLFPMLVLTKLKDKFDYHCPQQLEGMLDIHFKKLYAHLLFDDIVMNNLFYFFAHGKKRFLKFKDFVGKYACICKCDQETISKIIFQLYKSQHHSQTLAKDDYKKIITTLRDMFAFQPSEPQQSKQINSQYFRQLITSSGFYFKDFQKKFNLIQKQDIPFEAIERQLVENEINDLQVGKFYYVLSTNWFERWSFYYQGQNHMVDQINMKSTKLMLKGNKIVSRRSYNRKLTKNNSNISQHTMKNINNQTTTLIQQPTKIQYDDIEGEYSSQLKQGLQPQSQCKYINEKLWKMLITMHTPSQIFRRQAISSTNLQLYPKTVLYFETFDNGTIDYTTYERYQLGLRNQLGILNKSKDVSFFVKDFKAKNWSQQSKNKMLVECSTSGRFFVVCTKNRIDFIQKNTRKEITLDTLSIGDKIYTQFPFQKKIIEAYILSINNNKYKVHYIGQSYKYQAQITKQDIFLEQSQSPKKKINSIYKGIINIGNTCFINSVIQCLLSTPVLEQYLSNKSFQKKKAPLLYSITQIAKKLLKNQSAQPYQLKKIIDINLPAFSGHDQHDAQQFLSLLLDKMNEQLKQKPTVFDQLFGGKSVSKLTCLKCSNIRNINQNFYTLSLPIPQAQYNFFTIFLFPIYGQNIKKIVIKLHKTATANDYMSQFENRSNLERSQVIFCQTHQGCLNKVRSDISNNNFRNKKLTQIGLSPDQKLFAYEKMHKNFLSDLIRTRDIEQVQFYDYLSQELTSWGIAKIIDKKREHISIQFLNNDYQIQNIKLARSQQKSLYTLGTKVNDTVYHKITHRRYNSVLKQYESFGLDYLVGFPKWASYVEIGQILDRVIKNLKVNQTKGKKDNSTIYRFVDSNKFRCIFCQKDLESFSKIQQATSCCSILEKRIPLAWTIKKKSFTVYVDWIKYQQCNSLFFSNIIMDTYCKAVEQQKLQQKINLDECFNLFKEPEKVQMQCDKCKHHEQTLQTSLKALPNILILHMKQFRYTNEGHLIKLDIRLKKQQFLDVYKYVYDPTTKSTVYELFGFIRHSGSSHSGHYTSISKRKHPVQDKKVWVNFDDDCTQIIKNDQNGNIDNAYLLFYKKVDMPTSAYVNFTNLI